MGGPGLALALTLGALAGCSLGKRGDATDPYSSASLRSLSNLMEPQSNLARSSGEVTYFRLSKLFPDATQGTTPFLKQEEFQTLSATGLNRAIAQDSRPATGIAQVALRKWAAPLCKNHLSASAPRYSMFGADGVLMSGEAAPGGTANQLAFLAARNTWLDVYAPDSKEVQVLASLYQKTLDETHDAAVAKQALCMAALLAPQFWLGASSPRDALRRTALEIGHVLPTFADYEKLGNKQLSLTDYVKKLQTDPALQPAYLGTLHKWHESWWGLRPFLPYGGVLDPRSDNGFNGSEWGISPPGAGFAVRQRTLTDGKALVQSTGYYRANVDYDDGATTSAESCVPETGGVGNVQAFDPRTSFMTKEHRRDDGVWEVVGAFVGDDAAVKADFVAYMAAYTTYTMTTFNNECALVPTNHALQMDIHPPTVAGYPQYFMCKGRVTVTPGVFRTTQLRDFDQTAPYIIPAVPVGGRTMRYPASRTVYQPIGGALLIEANALNGTVHEAWGPGYRRIRRKSPSGWQDGISPVKTWYTRDTVYACNALSRFQMSCALRPDGMDGYGTWWYVNGYNSSGEGGRLMVGAYRSLWSMGHPMLLNQYRCGPINVAALPPNGTDVLTPAMNEVAYPHGYSLTGYFGAQTVSLNPNMTFAVTATTTPAEESAAIRAGEDIMQEPYRLLDDVVSHGKPYSEMFTANYTYGREELELYYRSQNYVLPDYPPGYAPTAATDPARLQVRLIPRANLPAIPVNWLRGPLTTTWPSPVSGSDPIKQGRYLPRLPASGVITMPAFLGPVSQKMRTIASRFYTRLLCGEPNMYQPPDDATKALHKQFMVLPTNAAANATAALHLDEQKGCFMCHVNLDPLGQALSGRFLANVQVSEVTGMNGDLLGSGAAFGQYYLGARAGGMPGDGAFLGKPVRGFEDVGRVLAASRLTYACTVRRTFEAIYGRPISISDARAIAPIVDVFQAKPDYNLLIQNLVGLKAYSEED